MKYLTSIVLDTRRPKGNGLYPVKLRVYSTQLQVKKMYATKYDLSENDFESIWLTVKPRNEHKETRNELRAIELRANEVCKKLQPFSFDEFEKRFLQKAGDNTNIVYHYTELISKLKANNSHSTASNYHLSLKSFKDFIKHNKGIEPTKINFFDITKDWLQDYENYMINDLDLSRTTVSMYVRTLRTVFNNAIKLKDIDADYYPFGKDKYQPPTVKSVKKALSKADLKKLFDAKPLTPEQEKAKDFWFFSYACNGMNIKDIALLKHSDLKGDTIVFYRAKTIHTAKTDLRPVTVYLNEYSKGIINKYSIAKTETKEYLFPIISITDKGEIKHNKIKNFTKFINQNLKKLATINGITSDISTYWARHSFATNAIRSGASMEFVMEALSHNNLKTTQGYFAGFEENDKKEFMQKLMDF